MRLVDGKRRRVYSHLGCEGYYVAYTSECTGCTEYVEMGGRRWGPFGCEECGYRGRVRNRYFVPFPEQESEYGRRLFEGNDTTLEKDLDADTPRP